MAASGGRRHFFKQFARESLTFVDEIRGIPQCRLSDLHKLPDNVVLNLIPQVCPGVQILVEDGQVRARIPGREESKTLFALEDPDLEIFNQFNGINTIAQVAQNLAGLHSCNPDDMLPRVRGLFFRLAQQSICVPGNPA
jgi:hypothetical protein